MESEMGIGKLAKFVRGLQEDNAALRTQLAEAKAELACWDEATAHIESGDPLALLELYERRQEEGNLEKMRDAFSDMLEDFKQVIVLNAQLIKSRASLATLTARYEALRESLKQIVAERERLTLTVGFDKKGMTTRSAIHAYEIAESALVDAPEALGRRQEAVEEPHEGGHEGG